MTDAETITVLGLTEEMQVGELIRWAAVAQQKPPLRKAIMADIANAKGTYSVRYVGSGVELKRLA